MPLNVAPGVDSYRSTACRRKSSVEFFLAMDRMFSLHPQHDAGFSVSEIRGQAPGAPLVGVGGDRDPLAHRPGEPGTLHSPAQLEVAAQHRHDSAIALTMSPALPCRATMSLSMSRAAPVVVSGVARGIDGLLVSAARVLQVAVTHGLSPYPGQVPVARS